MKSTTASQIIARAKREQPHLRLAVSASGGAIGAFDERKGRFVMVAGKLIIPAADGGEAWVNCPVEILVNGKPAVDDWVEA